MPLYRNDTKSTVIVKNTEYIDMPVAPGETVETFETVDSLTLLNASPVSEIKITAESDDTVFTSAVPPLPGESLTVQVAFSQNTGDVPAVLQRSLDGGSTWADFQYFFPQRSVAETYKNQNPKALFRIGIENKDTNFAGSIFVRLN